MRRDYKCLYQRGYDAGYSDGYNDGVKNYGWMITPGIWVGAIIFWGTMFILDLIHKGA